MIVIIYNSYIQLITNEIITLNRIVLTISRSYRWEIF